MNYYLFFLYEYKWTQAYYFKLIFNTNDKCLLSFFTRRLNSVELKHDY